MSYDRHEPIQPIRVRRICECGDEMLHTGEVLTMNPPRYVHKCAGCGELESLDGSYPHIAWE